MAFSKSDYRAKWESENPNSNYNAFKNAYEQRIKQIGDDDATIAQIRSLMPPSLTTDCHSATKPLTIARNRYIQLIWSSQRIIDAETYRKYQEQEQRP